MTDVLQHPGAARPAVAAGRQRDPVLDLLKAVGLVGIVIAHTHPPAWLYQARSFGLPVMAFVAGAVLVESRSRAATSTGAYLRRRLQQLFVPTWAFVAVGGAVLMVLATVVGQGWDYSPDSMLRAFLLLDDAAVTNTQVVRVFLLVSLSAPVWLALHRRTPRLGAGLASIGGVLVLYELACWRWSGARADAGWVTELLVQDIGLYTVGFGVCFALGTRYRELSTRQLLALAALLAAALAVFFLVRGGGWVPTHRWKWPPRFPYLAYAGVCGLTMAALFRSVGALRRLGASRPVRTASAASLWFFFWHSFALQLWNILVGHGLFLVELPLNLLAAYGLLTIEQHLVRRWLERDLSDAARRRIRTVFALR